MRTCVGDKPFGFLLAARGINLRDGGGNRDWDDFAGRDFLGETKRPYCDASRSASPPSPPGVQEKLLNEFEYLINSGNIASRYFARPLLFRSITAAWLSAKKATDIRCSYLVIFFSFEMSFFRFCFCSILSTDDWRKRVTCRTVV